MASRRRLKLDDDCLPFNDSPETAETFQDFGVTALPEEMVQIRVDQDPVSKMWKLPLMFRIGNNGVTYIWQIGWDGTKLRILHGPVSCTTVDPHDVETNTSGRSLDQQALQEARAKYKNKFYDGYLMAGSSDPPHSKGMKGYPYKGQKLHFPVLISPKLDGIRLLVQHKGGKKVECRTYLNRELTHLTEIQKETLELFSYLPAYSTLDGEMYNHSMTFHEIASAVKTLNYDHPERVNIHYYIFDIITEENPPSEERYEMLLSSYTKYVNEANASQSSEGSQEMTTSPTRSRRVSNVFLVPQYVAHSHDDLESYFDEFVSLGYEGLIIRRMGQGQDSRSKGFDMARYKAGRSTRLFKMKVFHDEEATVIGVESAKGKEAGAALLIIRDGYGVETTIRFGTMEERAQWMKTPSLVIGKIITFKHVGRSADNHPIQPTGKCFRDYED